MDDKFNIIKLSNFEIPTNQIEVYCHCNKCFKELPENKSLESFAHLNIGWTKLGIQVWCVRHDCNVMHIDFEGMKHPANISIKDKL